MKKALKVKRKKKFTLSQKFSHWLLYGFVRLLWAATRFIPWSLFYLLARIAAVIATLVMRRRRAIAFHNLALAFSDKDERERKEIFKNAMTNLTVGATEVLHFTRFPEKLDSTRIVMEGVEHLDHALSHGRGVLALTGHLGNFILCMIKLAQLGYPINSIVRQPEIEAFARFISHLSRKVKIGQVADKPPEECVHRSLELLRGKELLFLHIDLNVSRGAAYVDFFGQLVPTFKGPAILALRTDAPIVPVFVAKAPDGRHRVIIEPAVEYEITGDRDQDVLMLTAKLSKIVERYVRAYPEEWLWIHQRFRKARPLPSR